MFEEKIEMDFRLSPKTLSLLEEDEFDWTPPESKKMPTFAIFTPSTYEVRIKSKKPQVPLLKNLSLNKNRLHVKNLEFKTRLLHFYWDRFIISHEKILYLKFVHSLCFISNTVKKRLVSHFQNSIVCLFVCVFCYYPKHI